MKEQPDDFASFLISTLVALQRFAENVVTQAISVAEAAERQYRRAQLLEAYRARRRWKKSDIGALNSLDVNAAARRRMARLSGRGRPIVRPYIPLLEAGLGYVNTIQPLLAPDYTPNQRRHAVKSWPWWRHHVEALYRGEHESAKLRGTPDASGEAERLIGRYFGISPSTVHAICGDIRRERVQWDGAADFPSVLLAQFEQWMRTGQPDCLDIDDGAGL